MPTLNYPINPSENEEWTDNAGIIWIFFQNGWQQIGGTVGGGAIVPTGVIMAWPTGTSPSGFLLCNGAAAGRNTWPDLFSLIGTTFGAGDGSTTFNLPNYVGKVLAGTQGGDAIASTRGAEEHTLQASEIPAHSHAASADQGGYHNHTGTTASDGGHGHTGSTNGTGDHTHSTAGFGTQTKQGGGDNCAVPSTGTNTGSNGSHSHSLTVDAVAGHTHGLTVNHSETHAHVINVFNAGGSGPHNNMQPTSFVNWIIKT